MDLCLKVLKESNKTKFDSYSVRNSVLIISHVTFRDCRVHIFLRQPFSRKFRSTNESRLFCGSRHSAEKEKSNSPLLNELSRTVLF